MIATALRLLTRTGLRRALSGAGGRGWLAVGLAAATLQFLNRRSGEPKVSLTEKLEPGQSLLVTHFPKPEKRRRR